jgi:hypothetical protein
VRAAPSRKNPTPIFSPPSKSHATLAVLPLPDGPGNVPVQAGGRPFGGVVTCGITREEAVTSVAPSADLPP